MRSRPTGLHLDPLLPISRSPATFHCKSPFLVVQVFRRGNPARHQGEPLSQGPSTTRYYRQRRANWVVRTLRGASPAISTTNLLLAAAAENVSIAFRFGFWSATEKL